ncbi:MAG: PorT family protein [Bacteroidales bacterium]|nr:PorT family protein [Bacteroidales bacterium]
MKYLATVLLFFIIIQSSVAQRFTGGITAGLTATQVDGDTYKGYNKAGLTVGGWVNISLSDHSAFHTGINYIQKGSRHNPDYDKGDLDKLIIRLGYVEMPLLYQYKLKSGFFLEAGTSIGVLLHSYAEFNLLEQPNNPFRLMDVSFQAGIGYKLNDRWKAGIRSGNSMASIRKERVDGDRRRLFGYGQYNSVLAIELAYSL